MMSARTPDSRALLPSPGSTGEGLGVRASADNPSLILLQTSVNNRPVTLEIEPRAILLDVLRDDLGLTGAKRSCDTQVCGACTVLLNGSPVSACCTLAYEAGGREVETGGDVFESEAYTRQLARIVGRKAIAAAIARSTGDQDERHVA